MARWDGPDLEGPRSGDHHASSCGHVLTLSALGVLLSGVATSTGPVALADPAPSQDRTRDRASGPRTIDPRKLDRGPDAAVDHLQDGVIHAADGTTVRVGIPHGRQRIALLGAVGTAWAVATWRADPSSGPGVATVDLVRRGAPPVRVPRSRTAYYADSYVGFRLSRDGAQLMTTTYDRGGARRSCARPRRAGWTAPPTAARSSSPSTPTRATSSPGTTTSSAGSGSPTGPATSASPGSRPPRSTPTSGAT